MQERRRERALLAHPVRVPPDELVRRPREAEHLQKLLGADAYLAYGHPVHVADEAEGLPRGQLVEEPGLVGDEREPGLGRERVPDHVDPRDLGAPRARTHHAG